jgi:hypothetical protein
VAAGLAAVDPGRVHDDAAPRLRRAPPRRANDLLASGFARWYRVEPRRGATATAIAAHAVDDTSTIEHAVRGYSAVRSLVVTTVREVVTAVGVNVASSDDGTARPFFAEFVTSFLRTLEPDDSTVRAITARLRAQVGLGADVAGDGRASTVADEVVAALLGARADAHASLDHGELRVLHAEDAVDVAWIRRGPSP